MLGGREDEIRSRISEEEDNSENGIATRNVKTLRIQRRAIMPSYQNSLILYALS